MVCLTDIWVALLIATVLLFVGVYLKDRQIIRWAVSIMIVTMLASSGLLTNVTATLDLTALLK